MNLFLLRHGIAVDISAVHKGGDPERRLTPQGRRKVAVVAQAVKRIGCHFDHILTSPYKRAFETAEIVADVLQTKNPLRIVEDLKPGGDFVRLLETVSRRAGAEGSILLVGHEPFLSELASVLISGQRTSRIKFKKAALCKLSIESNLRLGRCGSLAWMLTLRIAQAMTR